MYEHFIVLGESYRKGKRIAYHHYAEGMIDQNFFEEFKSYRQTLDSNLSYAVHRLFTESGSFESVIAMDSYFEGVKIYDTREEFFKEITEDKKISAVDIAKYLLTLKPMTHLKLQKLLYLVYEDYLLTTQKSLFPETIVAWKFGPVVKEVYEKYKDKGREIIDDVDEIDTVIPELAALSKILKADDFEHILESVYRTLEKYGDWSSSQLVEFTHLENKPWQRVYGGSFNQSIPDEIILEYACIK